MLPYDDIVLQGTQQVWNLQVGHKYQLAYQEHPSAPDESITLMNSAYYAGRKEVSRGTGKGRMKVWRKVFWGKFQNSIVEYSAPLGDPKVIWTPKVRTLDQKRIIAPMQPIVIIETAQKLGPKATKMILEDIARFQSRP